jgi:hypothetical protein
VLALCVQDEIVKLFISKEKAKRIKADRLRRYAQINWKIKKPQIEQIFHETFDDFDINGKHFSISGELNSDFSDKTCVGYDCIQVTHPPRFTGNMIITKTKESTNFDHKREVGAALSITTSKLGKFDIFLIPAENDDKVIESKDLIIYSCNDPNKLTKYRINKSIKQFLKFQRVDSLFECASFYERVYVTWLHFVDARNRDKHQSLLFQITNHWGAVILSGIVAWVIAKNT